MTDKITLANIEYQKVPLNQLCVCKNSPLLMPDAKKVGKYSLFNANILVGKCDFGENKDYISIIKYGSGIGKVKLRSPFSNVIGTMGIINQFDNTDLLYLYYYLQVADFRKYIEVGTAPNMYFEDFGNLELFIPDKEHQEFIGKLFKTLDNLIENETQELIKLEQYKKTMLYKMFPTKGQDALELRFKGCNTQWKRNKFGLIFDKINKNSFSRDLLNYKKGNVKNIHYGDILIKFGFTVDPIDKNVPYINEDVDISNYNNFDFLKDGDVIFADTAEDTTAGKMVEIKSTGTQKVLSGLHTFPCRPKIQFASGFLGILLNTPFVHNQLIPYMQGTKVTSFNYDSLCKIEISYPENLEEQEKIVNLFCEIDKIMDNTKKEIEALKHLQTTLLNKLYI